MGMTDAERFMRYVVRDRLDGCWLWTGAKSESQGGRYGHFWFRNRAFRAHRAAFVLFVGRIRKHQVIDHRCGVPLCVNPAHLRSTTQRTNIRSYYRA